MDWASLFYIPDDLNPTNLAWNSLFVTDLGLAGKAKKVKQVKTYLEQRFDDVLTIAQHPGLSAQFEGETLPGGLEPSAFKGSKSTTRAQYSEAQTEVDSDNWALACLGGALVGRYVWQRRSIMVMYPVPEKVSFFSWRGIRDKTYGERLSYLGVQNAVAHYSVVLCEAMRKMASSSLAFSDRFSNLAYFSLFKTGNQWKPSTAGFLNLQPLLNMALGRPHETAEVFETWAYLFRRGSVRGYEDLSEAITKLIMSPSLENLERHNRVLLRYIDRKEIKAMNQYTEDALKEVMQIVDTSC
ncbi:MAG: hypothetical protein QUS09_02180 [Methanotrichaceae archaeon]|nr:hypothetical protein [Methanotrichaceae archaeon]